MTADILPIVFVVILTFFSVFMPFWLHVLSGFVITGLLILFYWRLRK